MDFGALPPELNSGRIYSGPGPGPLLAAAQAWEALAAELHIAATGYGSVVAELSGQAWSGPAASSMAAAAAPYVAWMHSTALQAEETAMQARAAVAAYEAAFAMTVPPPVIAANRVQLMTLVATNFFGQNAPAIAATELLYAQMWAQDAVAMYVYAGSAAAASAVTPFAQPTNTTNDSGIPAQGAAVAKAAGTQAGSTAQTAAQTTAQLVSTGAAPNSLSQAAASGTTSGATVTVPAWLQQTLDALTPANRNALVRAMGLSYFTLGTPRFGFSLAQQLMPGTPSGAGGSGSSVLAPGGWGPPMVSWPGASTSGISASLGQASTVGRLSVPPSWGGSTPQVRLTSLATPLGGGGTPDAPAGLLRGMPLSGMGRRGGGGLVYRYGFRHTVMPRPHAVG